MGAGQCMLSGWGVGPGGLGKDTGHIFRVGLCGQGMSREGLWRQITNFPIFRSIDHTSLNTCVSVGSIKFSKQKVSCKYFLQLIKYVLMHLSVHVCALKVICGGLNNEKLE